MAAPRRKILHIDDDEHVLHAVKRSLEYADFEVASTTGPFVGHLIEREQPDLIVLDVEMPYVSGDKMVAIVKSHPEYSDLPIVFFSGKSPERIQHLIKPGGKIFYVSKEAGMQRLLEVIAQALS